MFWIETPIYTSLFKSNAEHNPFDSVSRVPLSEYVTPSDNAPFPVDFTAYCVADVTSYLDMLMLAI